MSKKRIIINIEDGVDERVAIHYVRAVMEMGRISKGYQGRKCYCWITTFGDLVVAVKNKHKTDSDIFNVYKTTNE